MTIPSDLDFAEWLQMAKKPLDVPEDISVQWGPTAREMTRERAEKCVRAINTAQQEAIQRLHKTEMEKWLYGQREFGRARLLVYEGRKKGRVQARTSYAEDTERYIVETMDFLFTSPLTEMSRDAAVIRRLLRMATRVPRPWVNSLVFALREYHYGNSAQTSLALSRSLPTAIDKAKKSLDAALAQLETAAAHNFIMERLRPLESAAQLLNDLSSVRLPVHRNDERARERLFVYRMQKANRKVSKRPKAEAIGELMGMEGFAHQYDRRHLERLCVEFAGT